MGDEKRDDGRRHAYGFSYDPTHWAVGCPEPDLARKRERPNDGREGNTLWLNPPLGKGEVYCSNGMYILGRLVARTPLARLLVKELDAVEPGRAELEGSVGVGARLEKGFAGIAPVWSGRCDVVVRKVEG